MAQQTMYPGMVGSPTTTLTTTISGSATSFTVANGNALPEAPNLATLGSGQNAEIVLYSSKSGNTLSGVTRGFQGGAQPHESGTLVSRRLTAYDLDALRQNHEALVAQRGTANGVATLDANGNVPLSQLGENILTTVETVTVGPGGQYDTINMALEYFTQKYPAYVLGGSSSVPSVEGVIVLKSGFVMQEQVVVRGINLGWIRIISEVEEEILAKRSPLATHTGLFTGFIHATLPVISARFFMDEDGADRHQIGILLLQGSRCLVLGTAAWRAGVRNAPLEGFRAEVNSQGMISGGDFSNTKRWGIYALSSSIIECVNILAINCGSTGVFASRNSSINCHSGNSSGSNICVRAESGSTINADLFNGTNHVLNGAVADRGSRINIAGGDFRRGGTTNIADIVSLSGSVIAAGSAAGGTNITVNTLTNTGIIFR